MATLLEHHHEFTKGIISRGGFGALIDSEIYGNVSSIGAMEKSLAIVFQALIVQNQLNIHHPTKGTLVINDPNEFKEWCNEFLPSADWNKVAKMKSQGNSI